MLKGKHIVIGISGGIAAYKIPMLIRILKKQGADVRVCTTRNALQFVTEVTLQTLSNNSVYTDVFQPHREHSTEHISLPDWADLLIVAPATADIIGKFASGIADDALSTTFLAFNKPVLIAPAMNDKMLAHPIVQRNISTLAELPNITVMPCADGFLACGTTGTGRMAEPEQIALWAERELTEHALANKKVMINLGPTVEPIDPVRFISNYSSGKMGNALAEQCWMQGADVTIVAGPVQHVFEEAHVVNVSSAEQMYDASVAAAKESDIIILCAAVADYTPAEKAEQKLKRKAGEQLTLALNPTLDIAATIGRNKKKNQKLIGFALETQDEEHNAEDKMHRKNLDMIVLNSLQDKGAGFAGDTNKITIFFQGNKAKAFPLKSKKEVAKDIVQCICNL